MTYRVLVVDDEPRSLDAMEMALEDLCEVQRAASGAEALDVLKTVPVNLVLTDQRMPHMTGVELLQKVRADYPAARRMIITGYTDPEDMIDAINDAGVQRFIKKPWHPDELIAAVEAGMGAPANDVDGDPFAHILRSPGSEMERVVKEARTIAPYRIPCLLVGEVGTGRAALARAIAAASGFGPLRAVSCLTEDEAFAALSDRDGGTLFLREIDKASPALQVALQENLAANSASGSRIIASATTFETEKFVPELYFQLSVNPLYIPTLNERRQDIPMLAEHFLAEARRLHGIECEGFSRKALKTMAARRWPGNLRGLESLVTRLLVFSGGDVIDVVPPSSAAEEEVAQEQASGGEILPLKDQVSALEVRLITEALDRFDGNKSRAAEALGLSRVGLRAKLDRYGLE